MIEVSELTQEYGDKRAVNRLSFLDVPTAGAALVNGQRYTTIELRVSGVLLFDEPAHGLDPEGAPLLRNLMRLLAAQGRMVLVSSHGPGGTALKADQVLIIGPDELVKEISARELTERVRPDVFVRSPRRGGLAKVLVGMGATVLAEPGGGLSVTGMEAWRIASAAAAHHIPIQELTPRSASLEDSCPDQTSSPGRP